MTSLILNLVMSSMSIPGMIALLSPIENIPTTPRDTLVVVGYPMHPYVPSFTLPLVTRDYPYGMPTTIMASLQSHTLTFVHNVATIASPLNPYLAPQSVISNPGRMAQPQGGFGYVPQGLSALTTISLVSIRQQMDESNHEMVNMLT